MSLRDRIINKKRQRIIKEVNEFLKDKYVSFNERLEVQFLINHLDNEVIKNGFTKKFTDENNIDYFALAIKNKAEQYAFIVFTGSYIAYKVSETNNEPEIILKVQIEHCVELKNYIKLFLKMDRRKLDDAYDLLSRKLINEEEPRWEQDGRF